MFQIRLFVELVLRNCNWCAKRSLHNRVRRETAMFCDLEQINALPHRLLEYAESVRSHSAKQLPAFALCIDYPAILLEQMRTDRIVTSVTSELRVAVAQTGGNQSQAGS